MKTKKDFESAAAQVRALPMNQRKALALQFAENFKTKNTRFDSERFFAACMVHIDPLTETVLAEKQVEINLREVEFTISYRWNGCDVDAAIVPHLSLCCGSVVHKVGEADMLGGGYDAGKAELTPFAGDVVSIAHHWANHTKWPKGVESIGGYPKFVQGYCDAIFKYEGELNKLESVIVECKEILATLIKKHVRYYSKGAVVKNGKINSYAGTGSGIRRVE